MANRLKGEASFADDEHGELTLCFDAEAFLQIEDKTGIGLLDMAQQGGLASRLGVLAWFLVFGLRRHHPDLDLSREDAAEMLLVNSASQEAVTLALGRALPAPDKAASAEGNGRKGPRRPTRAGSGSAS